MSFVGTALGRFSQCFFLNFLSQTIVADIFIHSQPPPLPPTMKKLPTAMELCLKLTIKTSMSSFWCFYC